MTDEQASKSRISFWQRKKRNRGIKVSVQAKLYLGTAILPYMTIFPVIFPTSRQTYPLCVRRVKTCFRKLLILLQLLSIFCLYGFYRLLIYNASKKQLKWRGTMVDLLDLLSSKLGIDSSDFQVILWSSPRLSSWPFPFPYLHK